MNKIAMLAVCAAVMLTGSKAFSFGIPNVTGTQTERVVKDVVGEVAKDAVVKDLNKYLAGQNCTCNADGSVTGCDLNAIGKKINDNRSALKAFLNREVNFHSKAKSQECSWKVRDTIKHQYSYWYWYTPYDPSMGKKITLSTEGDPITQKKAIVVAIAEHQVRGSQHQVSKTIKDQLVH